MSNVKLFRGWLAESAEATSGTVSTWTRPVPVEVSKVIKGGQQNIVQVKSGGKAHQFKIIGIGLFGGKYEINYQKLEKTDKNGLKIYRYVDKGVDPYEVAYSELEKVLPNLAKGLGATISGKLGDIKFEKI